MLGLKIAVVFLALFVPFSSPPAFAGALGSDSAYDGLCVEPEDWSQSQIDHTEFYPQFYNTSSLQRTRRTVILALRGGHFNYQTCEGFNEAPRATQVVQYQEHQCHWLSPLWLPIDYLPALNGHYGILLELELENLLQLGESSRSYQHLLQSLGPTFKTMASVILIQALHHYPQIYGGGRVRGTVVRGVAWVALYFHVLELIRSYHLPKDFVPDSDVRALEVEQLLRQMGDWSPLGPNLEYATDRLMFTQRDLVRQALEDTVDLLCPQQLH